MSLQMSEHEICMMYRDAKDKNEQIKILADLNVCDNGAIIDVLAKNGFVTGLLKRKPAEEKPRKYKRPNTAFRFSNEEVAEIEKLYAGGIKTNEIAEKLGLDYKTVSNKICNMNLPKKYRYKNPDKPSKPKTSTNSLDTADKLYIETLQNELKAKDEELNKAITNCEAYKIELGKLMDENELLREADKYREKFDTEVEALNDAIIMLDLLQVMARQDSNPAVFGALVRANELISGVIKELL